MAAPRSTNPPKAQRLGLVLLSLLLVWSTLALAATGVPSSEVTAGVQRTVLRNGLTVLTKEVRRAPTVAVQVWYRVGSRNEARRAEWGISHQIEHLMFKGTTDRPIQFGRLLDALGSDFNAYTSYANTTYLETAGREKLEALLTLEADRMQRALMGAAELRTERQVVLSELEGDLNSPEFLLDIALLAKAFARGPYHHPVIGSRETIEGFTPEEVQRYYRRYYAPGNATLVIVGDFDTTTALGTVRRLFESIPRGRVRPAPGPSRPRPGGPHTVTVSRPGTTAYIQVLFPTVPLRDPDTAPLTVLDEILTDGRSSRLYKALVDTELAAGVGGSLTSLPDAGWYTLSATVRNEVPPRVVAYALQRALDEIALHGVTPAEVRKAQRQIAVGFLMGSEDLGAQADRIGYYETLAGDYRYADAYLRRIAEVTADEVQRVARRYLRRSRSTAGFFFPQPPAPGQAIVAGPRPQGEVGLAPQTPVEREVVRRYLPPVPRTPSPWEPAPPARFVLANGLVLLVQEDHTVPTVNLVGFVDAGTGFDPEEKAGLARLTAGLLLRGTRSRTAAEIAETLDGLGASLSIGAEREGAFISGSALSADLPVILSLLGEALQAPTFPRDELNKVRGATITRLREEEQSPSAVAVRTFQKLLYPAGHPYHAMATPATVEGLGRDDLVRFHREHYRPDTMILVVGGDVRPEAVRVEVEKAFGDWRGAGKAPRLEFPTPPDPAAPVRQVIPIPGTSEDVAFFGWVGLRRTDADYYPALVLNRVLGGDTLNSLLGRRVRDEQGLTYGIFSSLGAGQGAGPWLVTLQSSPANVSRAVAEAIKVIRNVVDSGVDPAEIADAKESLLARFPLSLTSNAGIAGLLLDEEIYRLGTDYPAKFREAISAVTAADAAAVGRRYFLPDRYVLVIAGPPPQ